MAVTATLGDFGEREFGCLQEELGFGYPPAGSESDPWQIGDDVQAYTNGSGGLIITGAGATSNFTDAVSLPWSLVTDSIDEVTIPEEVTVIGGNLWAGLGKVVVINGETIVRRKGIAAGFPDEDPSGAISPAEFERIDIVDGRAQLGVSVYTNATLEAESVGESGDDGWGVATNIVIEVAAPAEQGFFILQTKCPADVRPLECVQ